MNRDEAVRMLRHEYLECEGKLTVSKLPVECTENLYDALATKPQTPEEIKALALCCRDIFLRAYQFGARDGGIEGVKRAKYAITEKIREMII